VKLLNIHQFAQLCRTTPRTLRFYEEKGLFGPFKIDEWTKYRYYREDQAQDFLQIKLLQSFHIPLKELKEEKSQPFLIEKTQSLEKELEERKKEIFFLKNMYTFFFQAKDIGQVLHTETFGPHKLFTKLFVHAGYDKVGEYVTQVESVAKKAGIPTDDSDLVFYHDESYNPKNTTVEVALIVKSGWSGKIPEGYLIKQYPVTKILTYDYFGPYEYFILLYQKLFAYLKSRKIELTGHVFDYYIQSKENSESVYDIHTKLCFPVHG